MTVSKKRFTLSSEASAGSTLPTFPALLIKARMHFGFSPGPPPFYTASSHLSF